MSGRINCDAELRKVGQGGFYTAKIESEGGELFSLVYDCGSDTKGGALETEIEAFHRGRSRALNMLVLSHFDADHVNGLDSLLNSVGRTDYVFLPYFTPIERLLCALRFPNEADATYYAFLLDPVTFLLARGVERIVFIGGGEEGDEAAPPDGPPDVPEYSHDRPPKIDISDMRDDGSTKQLLAKENSAHAVSPAVMFKTDDRAATLAGLWRFLFFHREEELRDAVHSLMNKSAPRANGETEPLRIRAAGFLDDTEAAFGSLKQTSATGAFDPKTVLAAIQNGQTRKKIKKTYGRLIPIHNDVSLLLWHGPVQNPNWRYESTAYAWDSAGFGNTGRHFFPGYRTYPRSSLAGTMLTGDLNLKRRVTRTKLLEHYSRSLQHTAFFVLPHHGSHENFLPDPDILKSYPTCLVSAGLRNKYGHPHLDLVERLEEEFDLEVFWSHERASVTLRTVCEA